jgi:hypothetical protein
MHKRAYFDVFDGPGWPDPAELKPYFFGAAHWQKWFAQGNDSWGLSVDDLDSAAEADHEAVRLNVRLYMTGHPTYGVTLDYSKWDSKAQKGTGYCSRGDSARLAETICSVHGTPLSIGLFIPFPAAWEAVKEFIERDGELPACIEWVAVSDLPPAVFAVPGGDVILEKIFGRKMLRD